VVADLTLERDNKRVETKFLQAFCGASVNAFSQTRASGTAFQTMFASDDSSPKALASRRRVMRQRQDTASPLSN
jgi:hypothetical protein